MSQPSTRPAPAPVPTAGVQAVETSLQSDATGSGEPTEAALSQQTGPVDPGTNSKPCSYLSLFRSVWLDFASARKYEAGKYEDADKLMTKVAVTDMPISSTFGA